jgi:dephospho-CoA kinase
VNVKKHIAVVAPIGAGKTTLAKYFQSKGFKLYKLTYAIYDECDRLGLDREDRATLQDIGDKLRKELGSDGLAQIAIKEVKKLEGRFVIDSIRNHNELKRLMKNFGDDIVVIAVTAPLKVRYKRIVGRKGQYREDKKTLEEFRIDNDRDLGLGNAENEQNVQKCIDMAQVEIENSGTEKEFIEKLDLLYSEYFEDS